MKRLHHFLIFILSVTILCLSTGMSHIHICSDQCCKAKSCLMHSPIQPDTDSCCKASPSSKTTSQQLSASCTCFQIDYTAEFYFQPHRLCVACCNAHGFINSSVYMVFLPGAIFPVPSDFVPCSSAEWQKQAHPALHSDYLATNPSTGQNGRYR